VTKPSEESNPNKIKGSFIMEQQDNFKSKMISEAEEDASQSQILTRKISTFEKIAVR
jgi:hypothetical protein